MIKLKKYQKEALQELEKKKYLILAWGTGVGKTYPFLKKMEDGQRTIIFCPQHIISQWEFYLTEYAIPYAVYNTKTKAKVSDPNSLELAGFDKKVQVVIVSAQTFVSRFKKLPRGNIKSIRRQSLLKEFNSFCEDKMILFDEFHRFFTAKTEMYNIFINVKSEYYGCMSATPFEKGAWELFYLFKVVKPIGFGSTNSDLKSFFSFKKKYCREDFWGNVNGIDKRMVKSFQNRIYYRLHTINIPIHKKIISIELTSQESFAVKKLNKNFTKRRQALNSFIYVDLNMDPFHTSSITKKIVNLPSNKIKYLINLISALKGKTVLFFEFKEERTQLENIDGIEIFTQKKGYQNFEKSSKNVLAVHYRSLGEGIRLPFLKNVIFYTLSMSNKMKKQALGRGMYDGRIEPINVYEFHSNSHAELEMTVKQNLKNFNLLAFLKGCKE